MSLPIIAPFLITIPTIRLQILPSYRWHLWHFQLHEAIYVCLTKHLSYLLPLCYFMGASVFLCNMQYSAISLSDAADMASFWHTHLCPTSILRNPSLQIPLHPISLCWHEHVPCMTHISFFYPWCLITLYCIKNHLDLWPHSHNSNKHFVPSYMGILQSIT